MTTGETPPAKPRSQASTAAAQPTAADPVRRPRVVVALAIVYLGWLAILIALAFSH